jgi:hypothetical protein
MILEGFERVGLLIPGVKAKKKALIQPLKVRLGFTTSRFDNETLKSSC